MSWTIVGVLASIAGIAGWVWFSIRKSAQADSDLAAFAAARDLAQKQAREREDKARTDEIAKRAAETKLPASDAGKLLSGAWKDNSN